MKHFLPRLGRLALFVWGLTLAPWSQAGPSAPAVQVVTSFSILADMVREIAADAAVVTSLVGPDADAHVYEPTPAAVKQMASAQLVVVNGMRFEGWMDRMIRISGYRGVVVVASRGVEPRLVNGAPDPHAWHDLARARIYVANLRDALCAAAPAHAAAIQSRASIYLRRIDELDQHARITLTNALEPSRRRLITSHDAFGYLGQAYGITMLSPQGWATGAEPSAGDVAKVIRQVRKQQVRALFVENINDPRLIQRIADESGARVGGMLYSDALSAPGGPADTYLKMMSHNLETIRRALAGDAP